LSRPVPLLAALGLVACGAGGRLAPPPPLFPAGPIWRVEVAPGVDSPPVTDGTRVLVVARDGVVRALDPETGEVAWTAPQQPGVLAAGDGIVVLRQPDGGILGLNPRNGRARWKTESRIEGLLEPAVDGDTIVVAGKGIAAMSREDGHVLWSDPSAAASSAPAVRGGLVVVGETSGAVRARDRATGRTLWTFATARPVLAPAVLDERRALLGTTDGRFLSLGLNKGGLAWRWRVGADVRARAALLGDLVLFTSNEAILYGLRRGSGNMVFRAPLPSRPLSGPILRESAVLVACYDDEIVGIDGRSGARLGAMTTPAEIQAAPLAFGDRLYVPLKDGTLVALRLPLPATPAPPAASPSPGASPSPASSPAASPSPSPSASPSPSPSPSPSIS
jgi:outer membrane protein assembly factor BamB